MRDLFIKSVLQEAQEIMSHAQSQGANVWSSIVWLVPILLRKSAIFRCPLCAQLFLCLCFPKVVIFDFHFSTMNDDLYGQVESKSSLWYKNQTIWLKNG